jgi:ATP-dependent Clp endopeptidase proteolytic subunit ClpP
MGSDATKLLTHRKSVLSRIPHVSRPYVVVNPAGPVAEIRIYDEIWFWGVNADDVARDLETITAPEILVAINSPGGDVFESIAIYNALRAHSARITTRVDGLAASGASLIVQAGDRRLMMSSAQLMIHEPWGIAIGPASEIREFADLLDKETEVLAGIYAERSGQSVEHFLELMGGGADVYLTDKESVAEGLADEVVNPPPKEPAPQNKRFNDELRETVDAVRGMIDSVERVAALRAEKGKDLSKVNADILDGLRAELRRLESVVTQGQLDDDQAPAIVDELEHMTREAQLLVL